MVIRERARSRIYRGTLGIRKPRLGLGNSNRPTPSLVFPSNVANIDMDFINQQYSGGILGDGSNSSVNGTLLRQQIVQVNPIYIEMADGSLKTYTQTSAIRKSDLLGLYIGHQFYNDDPQNRTFTNAAWNVVGGTPLKNQIGRTGVANSCCQITLTAPTCTITAAAASSDVTARDRVASIEGKQIVGSGGTLELSVDAGATFPALTTRLIAGAGGQGMSKYRFAAMQNIGAPQKQIKLTGTIGDVWVLDFSETLESRNSGQEAWPLLYEQPPTQTTTTFPLQIWRDRPTAAISGYSGWAPSSSAAALFLQGAVQVHYLEFWQRGDGNIVGVTVTSNQATGINQKGNPLNSGAGNVANLTTDLFNPVWNKLMCGVSADESFMSLNGQMLIGAGGDSTDPADHFDWLTNGSGVQDSHGGIRRHIMSTNYSGMKTLAQAGATL